MELKGTDMSDDLCQKSALAFYQTARDEMMLRIREREVAMYVWLGALGTIVTVAFRDSNSSPRALLILPVLALGISMRLNQHEILIAALAEYCKREVGKYAKLGCPADLKHWDESDTLKARQEWVVLLRVVVTLLLLAGPSAMALVLTFRSLGGSGTLFHLGWLFGVLATVVVTALEVYSLWVRIRSAIGRKTVATPTAAE
jgi:hypothetical protein